MRLRECFTLDLEARGETVASLRALVLKMMLDPGARAVAYYRVAVSLRGARRLHRVQKLLGELLLVRVWRVPGLEIR